MSMNVARGIVEYHLQKMQEELGDTAWDGRISFGEAFVAVDEVGSLMSALETYLDDIRSDYESGEAL